MKTSMQLVTIFLLCTSLIATNCSSEVADDGEHDCAPPITITVAIDETLQPYAASLPGINGGSDRRLGAVADEDDTLSSFVMDEVVLNFTADEELDSFLADTGGEVLVQIDPAEEGLPGLPQMALIRVETDGVNLDSLADDIASSAQAEGEGGNADLRFSSEESARLMALAMGKRKAGLAVGVNFVAPFQTIPDSTEEAPNTMTPEDDYWDAYGWDGWSKDGELGIGVPEAWSLLYYAGKLGNKVKIAIVDGGFGPNEDFPTWTSAGVHGGSGINQENPNVCTGGASCPWHGTGVASTAMALPDNRFGWAGTGGPVATGVFIQTGIDTATANLALIKAGHRNPKIINMSFGGKVNWSLRASLSYFENTTDRLRDRGILIFACSGNEGEDVDTSKCLDLIDYCWEDRFYYPCENTGVICVGGTTSGGGLHESSNHGHNSVKIHAPFQVWVGPDPDDNGANVRHVVSGTSVSTPFVAGVAALVWAADPSLSRSQVWNLIESTADGVVVPRVNAYQAVLQAMGTAFSSEIVSPYDGAELTAGVPFTATAEITVVSAPAPDPVPVTVEWYTTNVGLLATEEIMVPRTDPDGRNVAQVTWFGSLEAGIRDLAIIARADLTPEGWNGEEIVNDMDTVSVLVTNPGPEVEILQPDTDSEFCQGETITFRGDAHDPNETLPDSAYGWLAVPQSNPAFQRVLGEGPMITESSFYPEDYQVYLRVTDSASSWGEDSVFITILDSMDPACSDLDPQATILNPPGGQSYQSEGHDGQSNYIDLDLQALATDYEDDDATLLVEWFAETEGKLGEGANLTARIHMTEQCSQSIEITLQVTDSDNNMTPDQVTIIIWYVC